MAASPMHCLTCRHALSETDHRCPYCGARAKSPWWRRAVSIAVVVTLAVVLVVAGTNLFAAARRHGDALAAEASREKVAAADTTTTAPAAVRTVAETPTTASNPGPIVPTQAHASAQAIAGRDGCGQAVTYDAAFTIDGNPATAWRTKGDGTGQRLEFTLPSPTHLVQVGLIPGYAKVDSCNRADRFLQYRRILAVRWTFDGGSPVDQELAEQPAMQALAVDVAATRVAIEILRVTKGPQLDWTAISDISLAGVPAA